MRPPTQILVVTDALEQKPLLFPKFFCWWDLWGKMSSIKVINVEERLDAGDYELRVPMHGQFTSVAVAERKGALSELWKNFHTPDRPRAMRAFARMGELSVPKALFLDIPNGSFWRPTQHIPRPTQLLDDVLRVAVTYGLGVLYVPPGHDPRKSGEFLLRWMMAQYWYD